MAFYNKGNKVTLKCKHLQEMSEHVKIQDVKETDFPSLILGQVVILVTHRGEKALTAKFRHSNIYP